MPRTYNSTRPSAAVPNLSSCVKILLNLGFAQMHSFISWLAADGNGVSSVQFYVQHFIQLNIAELFPYLAIPNLSSAENRIENCTEQSRGT